MHDQDQQNDSTGQSGIDSETQQRNQENETGEQFGGSQSQAGQSQFGQSQDAQSQSGQADYGSAGQRGQSGSDQLSQTGQQGGAMSEGGSGFVGSGTDQSSDELTEGRQDFQPEGQGASDTDAGTADMTTGQPTSQELDARRRIGQQPLISTKVETEAPRSPSGARRFCIGRQCSLMLKRFGNDRQRDPAPASARPCRRARASPVRSPRRAFLLRRIRCATKYPPAQALPGQARREIGPLHRSALH